MNWMVIYFIVGRKEGRKEEGCTVVFPVDPQY
jgi:hypothetical protein